MPRSLALLMALCAPLAAQVRVAEPVAPSAPGVAAAARLSSVVLNLQAPTASSLTAPTLAAPSRAHELGRAVPSELKRISAARVPSAIRHSSVVAFGLDAS